MDSFCNSVEENAHFAIIALESLESEVKVVCHLSDRVFICQSPSFLSKSGYKIIIKDFKN